MSDVLKPYRVLDLSDERGQLCGQILGDLGADVIQVEPPGGSPTRQRGPFAGDSGDPNDSLSWWALNRNKRSLTLELRAEQDRATLRALARSADFLIESETPGVMDELGLGYDALSELNPALIYASITPFGVEGPKRDYAATDLTTVAASGSMISNGDADRPPVRLGPVPQGFLHASADAAIGMLAAHYERLHSGRGQRVSVSAQISAAQASQFMVLSAAWNTAPPGRAAGGMRAGSFVIRLIYAAKDGYVSLTFLSGSALGVFSRRFMEFACEEGFCDEATRDIDWLRYHEMIASGELSLEEYERVERILESFIASKTKDDWMRIALERDLLIVPVANVRDLVESPHFRSRGYLAEIEHASLDRKVRYPGAFARMSDTPIRYRRRAPNVGEHSAEILGELARRPAPERSPAPVEPASGGPLSGLKILDFMWVMAGPIGTRALTDLGATVVRIESPTRVDTARTIGPLKDGSYDPDAAGLFANCNAGKLGLALDLTNPASREVVHDLVRWADVVTESFSPKAMRNFGFAYDDLVKVKPDLIMLSSCLMGQTGPQSKLVGFGTMGSAIAGFQEITGWADRPPAGLFGAYTDYVACRFTAISVLAALEHRRQTGRGQYVDQSQVESTTHFLGPVVLDYDVNGRIAGRIGNADPHMSPHGVYPAAGEGEWVAVACRNDADWSELCRALDRSELQTDERFADLSGRLAHTEELGHTLAEWTATRKATDIERELQARGVPAHVVLDSAGFCSDPQLEHLGHLVEVEHPTMGTMILEGPRFRLSRTPAKVYAAAPTLGQHNHTILQNILGYDEDRITELVIAGVLG